MTSKSQGASRDVVDDLISLIRPAKPIPALRREAQPGALPAGLGVAEDNSQQLPGMGGGEGGGIASPLTETVRGYAETPEFLMTFDGSGYFRVRRAVQSQFVDAEGRDVVINWKEAGSV